MTAPYPVDIDELIRQKNVERTKQLELVRQKSVDEAERRNALVVDKVNEELARKRKAHEEILKRRQAMIAEREEKNSKAFLSRAQALEQWKQKKRQEYLARRRRLKRKVHEFKRGAAHAHVWEVAATEELSEEEKQIYLGSAKDEPILSEAQKQQEESPLQEEVVPSPTEAPKPKVRPPTGFMQVPKVRIDKPNEGLTELPEDVFASAAELKQLNAPQNKLACLSDQFSALTALTKLDLSYNLFNSNNNESCIDGLRQCLELKELNLSGNRIHKFPSWVSESWKNLTALNLAHSRLTTLPQPIAQLAGLTELVLRYNLLTELSPDIQNLSKLSSLNLEHNMLQKLPPEIGSLQELTVLNVNNNKLHDVPDDVCELVSLHTFLASDNEIAHLPHDFGRLVAMQVLDLTRNNLTELPDSVFPIEEAEEEQGLFELRELYLRQNNFKTIPDGFCYFGALEKLDLTANQIEALPEDIGYLCALKTLLLAENQLTSLPEQYSDLEALEELNVAHNMLTSLSSPNYYLMRLYAGYNQLSSFPSLEGMEYLRELHLSGNPLGSLPDTMFGDIALETLHARDIGLTEVPAELEQLEELEDLDLSCNNLTEFPESICALRRLRVLNISHNQIKSLSEDLDECYELQVLDFSHNDVSALPEVTSRLVDREVSIIQHHNPVDQAQRPLPSLKYAIADMNGRRPTMEDAIAVLGDFHGGDLFCVFDGHAGQTAARFAAEVYPNSLKEMLETASHDDQSILETMKECFVKVNEKFANHIKGNQAAFRTCGTTCLVCFVKGDKIYVANLGDTRAVLNRDGQAMRISADHKPADLAEEDRIRAHGGFVMIRGITARVNGTLGVARALGDHYLNPYITDEAFVDVVTMESTDKQLIIACDGIWDELSDQECVTLVDSKGGDLLQAAMELRDTAYLRGSDDNISVIVVQL